MRIRPSKKIIGVLSGALALSVLATGGIFWVQQGALADATSVLRQKELEVSDGQRIAQRREQARTTLEADRAKLVFLETAVSDSAFVPTLLKQLEELATRTRNKVNSVRPEVEVKAPTRLEKRRDPEALEKEGQGGNGAKAVEKEDPYTRLTIRVSLVGAFPSVQAFVERLMRFPKIIAVEELQIRPHVVGGGAAPGSGGLLDVDLKLTAFVMKEAVQARPGLTASADLGESKP